MNELSDAISKCMARTKAAMTEEASRLGCEEDDVERQLDLEATREARSRALAASGVSLPLGDLSRVVRDEIDDTEPLDVVRRWLVASLDRPILLLCGAVGVGKTLACAWAIAETGGGSVVHAPELPRRILPTRTDIDAGFLTVNLRASFLVLDDLGTEPNAGHARWAESFAIFVEHRLMTGRTVLTSNMTRAQFRPRYGERIASRLNAAAYVVELQERKSLRAPGGGL